MRALITGAGGFLGRHTVGLLRAHGMDVLTLGLNRRFDDRTVLVDLCDRAAVATIPSDVDAIVHLAAHVPAREGQAEAAGSLAANAQATLHLLEFARRNRIGCFVLGSSCSVYGDAPGRLPVWEDDLLRPGNFYGLSKLGGELLAGPYAFVHDIRVAILRFPYIYGPGMRQDSVVWKFLSLARRNEPIPVFGGGRDTTDLLFVQDAARGILQAMRTGAGTYNIGSGRETSIRQLAETVVAVTGSSSPIVSRAGETRGRRLVLSIEKAERELGWTPGESLASGLGETLGA